MRACVRARACACVCVCARWLKIVSTDKILHSINTLVVVVVVVAVVVVAECLHRIHAFGSIGHCVL